MNIDFSVLQPTQIYDYNDPVARQIRNKYSTYKNKVRELQREKRTNANQDGGKEEPKQSDVNKDRPNTEYAKSVRDALQKKVRNELYNKKGPNTISPILPVELSLTVLGNSYLEIGDYFNVNYLPSHYKDRVYFQIIGIEDKFSPESWETSYTSVMRVKPTKKSDYSKPSKNIIIPTKLISLPKQGHAPTNTLQAEKSIGIEVSSMKMINAGVHYTIPDGMKWQMSYELIKSTAELKKSYISQKALGRINYQVSKLSSNNSKETSLSGNSINLSFAYAIQEALLNNKFLQNIGDDKQHYGEIEHSSGKWKNGSSDTRKMDKAEGFITVVSYGDMDMAEIYDDFENKVHGDFGLSSQEEKVAERIYTAVNDNRNPGNPKGLDTLNSVIVGGGSLTQSGLYWTSTISDVKILRAPTAIRFREEGKNSLEDPDNPERILILELKTDHIDIFPILKIPKWVMDANDMTPEQLCADIFKSYEYYFGILKTFYTEPK